MNIILTIMKPFNITRSDTSNAPSGQGEHGDFPTVHSYQRSAT